MKRTLVLLLFSFIAGLAISGEDVLRTYLESQTRYWGIDKTMSAADLDQLVDLKRKADQPGLSQEERTKAYEDLFHFVQKLRGFPEGRVPAAMAANYWSAGQPAVRPALHFTKPGQLGNYIKRGTGDIPMILIPDIGADWSVFDSFMQRNQSRFTFYAVTLPGFGGTNPPPRQEKLDFGTMQWWNNATASVLDLITKQKLNHPLILGHQAGAYLAMKLALQRPELVRGVIVLNGLLYAPLPVIPQNTAIAERVRIVNSLTPAELFPYASKAHYFDVMMQSAPWFCKDKQRQESLTRLVTSADPTVWWNYFAELATTDLSGEIKSLKAPMLVLPSIYDRDLPGGSDSSKVALDQWNPLDHSKSSLPITVIPMQDCSAYATEDQPAKLDEAVRNWTNHEFTT